MKKWLLLMVVCAMGIAAPAQTNFRDISFQEALEVARKEKKMVFIDFYTDWCGPCKQMANEVFPQKKVGDYFNARFVSLKLNAEKAGKELAVRFNISVYPTFVVLTEGGKVQAELRGAMDADRFLKKLEESLDPELAPGRIAARYEKGERTPDIVNRYALSLMEQGKEEEGFRVVNDYYVSLSEQQRLEPANLFLFTRYTLALTDEKAAFLVAHRNDFDASVQEEVMERIKQLYHSEVTRYFSGYMLRSGEYKEKIYRQLKREMQELGLTQKGCYEPMFHLIEERIRGNDKSFLDACKEKFDVLDKRGRDLLVMNITRLVQTEDPAVLRVMAEFVRERLRFLSPAAISLSGRLLDDIESKFTK